MGVNAEQCPIEKIQFITRILYSADSNDKWAENELDYILFLKSHLKNLDLEPNPEEVKAVTYIDKKELNDFIQDHGQEKFTPWFLLMSQSYLPKWWENIDDLKKYVDHENIIRY